MLNFDLPKDQSSIIKVIGVGGGGSNAVNHMYHQGISGVDFVVCNTDNQALDVSPVPFKIQLGTTLTDGRGAGSIPEVGKNAAIEDIDTIRGLLEKNTKMVFITAGMGGGTGTGAAPVIAKIAKELGLLTVGIVTIPFTFEGRKRTQQAQEGVEAMRQSVDTLLIINNDRLREMYGNLSISAAFAQADDVLSTAARGIAELITVTGSINVDFEDVRTVMTDSGVAIMGSATATGENRALKAVEQALASPLLNDNHIDGARYVLLNITYGNEDILMDEISEITDFIQEEAGNSADVIWGHGLDPELGDNIGVTIIATGFNALPQTGNQRQEPKRNVRTLSEDATAHTPAPTPTPAPAPAPAPQAYTPHTQMQTPPPTPPVIPTEEPYLKPAPTPAPEPTYQAPTPTPPATPVEPTNDVTESQSTLSFDHSPAPTAPETPETPMNDEVSDDMPYLKSEGPAAVEPDAGQPQRAQDRINKLKDLSLKLRTPSGISDLENEPAYKRRAIELDDVPHSSDSDVSRFTLSDEEDENGERRGFLRDNNSFLHDNVD